MVGTDGGSFFSTHQTTTGDAIDVRTNGGSGNCSQIGRKVVEELERHLVAEERGGVGREGTEHYGCGALVDCSNALFLDKVLEHITDAWKETKRELLLTLMNNHNFQE
jgi:hypothetical protein